DIRDMVATVEEILEAVRRVQCGESKAAVVRSSAVTRTTLFHYIKMVKEHGTIKKEKRGPKQVLPATIEDDIVEWIAAMQRRGWPVDRDTVINKAGHILSIQGGVPRSVTRGWYQKFRTRNPILSSRMAQLLSKGRNAVNKEGIISYFNSLIRACVGFECDASDVYNVDETSFKTKNQSKKVVAIRGSRSVWVEEKAEAYHLTIVMTAAANGELVPPAFILPGVTCETSVMDACPVDGALVTTAPKAFMNAAIFNTWLVSFGEWKLIARCASQFVEAIGSGQRQGNRGSLSGSESHFWIQDKQETRGLKTQFELLIKTQCEGEARIDDFEETEDVRKDNIKRKVQSIENSGALMQRMAMWNLDAQGD
ncbi:hypothetical protein DYB31_012441, partial [Aphanomyces astaci]